MAWDKDKPPSSNSLRASNPQILANNTALENALNREHTFSTGGAATAQGQHKQGSAKVFFQDSEPTTQVDGGAFTATDLGSLWVDTDSSPDNQFNVLTATAPTWTPISTEIIATLLAAARVFGSTLGVTGNFAVNTNKMTVDAATGNTAIAGILEAIGLTTVADGSLTKTTAAPTTDAMIANKKYIDDEIAALILPSGLSGIDESIGETAIGELQIKWGKKSIAGNTVITLDFTDEGLTDFDNACLTAQVSFASNDVNLTSPCGCSTLNVNNMKLNNGDSSTASLFWVAIGR